MATVKAGSAGNPVRGRWFARLPGLCFLVWALTGCGGGGGGGEPAPEPEGDVGNHSPMNVGDSWIYQVVRDGFPASGLDQESVRVDRVVTVNNEQALAVQVRNVASGDLIDESLYVKSKLDLQLLAPAPGVAASTVLHFPLRVGDAFVGMTLPVQDSGIDADGDGRNETIAARYDVTVIATESVTVPAGTYAASMKVRTTLSEVVTFTVSGQSVTFTSTWQDWYAPGIGPVKTVFQSAPQFLEPVVTYTLLGYHVGSSRSETQGPTVNTTTPLAGATVGGSPVISARFSEPIEPTSLVAGSLTVRDAAGQIVAGSLSYREDVVTFTPAGALANGQYTATAQTTLTDLLGNPLAQPHTWPFRVDTIGPKVLSTTPVADALQVPLASPVVIDFDEVLDATGISSSSVTLTLNGNPVDATVTSSGSRVTLTPRALLEWGETYTVTVTQQVRDVAGNPLASDYRLRFSADPGRFNRYTATATGSWPEAVAIGDVDGDGRNDVVMSTSFYFDSVNDYKLFVFLQRPDGSLAPAQKIATRSDYVCRATSVAIGDVNGDGRNEIVVGESGCGIEVFSRDGTGAWSAPALLASADGQQVRIADLDNDGRADIAGIGWGSNTATVWYQRSTGALAAPVVYTVEHGGRDDLDTGDVNGDGLTDLVVLSGQASAGREVAVLRQAPGGGFSPAAYLGTAAGGSANGLAVGDVTGDGRADIVVSGGGNSPSSFIGVFRQQPDGSLAAMSTLASYDSPQPIEIADLNNDGRNDTVTAHGGWLKLGYHLQSSTGTLEPEQRHNIPYATTYNPHGLAVGDINGDGYRDAVLADYGSGLVVLYNTARTPSPATATGTATARKAASQRQFMPAAGIGKRWPTWRRATHR